MTHRIDHELFCDGPDDQTDCHDPGGFGACHGIYAFTAWSRLWDAAVREGWRKVRRGRGYAHVCPHCWRDPNA